MMLFNLRQSCIKSITKIVISKHVKNLMKLAENKIQKKSTNYKRGMRHVCKKMQISTVHV